MIPISPKTLPMLVGLNSSGADVRTLKDIEKDLAKKISDFSSSPPPIKIKMFNLLNRGDDVDGTEEENGRSKFLALMNDPSLDVVDIEYNMRQVGEGEDIRWHYTAVVTYRNLPFKGPCANYELHAFTLPLDSEHLGDFLTECSADTLVNRDGRPYIKKTSIIRQDKLYSITGDIIYYYHTMSNYQPTGDKNELSGIPSAVS